MSTKDETAQQVREEVRRHYAAAAERVTTGAACCSERGMLRVQPLDDDPGLGEYDDTDWQELPETVTAAALGCGNPVAVADLRRGEVVLDLGSGGGIDVILSGRRVGPEGTAYGLDSTDEMVKLARRNADDAGATNVHFLRGDIETIPLPDASVDVIISNCVINLAVDKPAVFAEMHRVLRPGARVGVTDVVAEDRLTVQERAERGDHAGCIAGALSTSEYTAGLTEAGFIDVTLAFTHDVADGMHGAIIRANKRA